MGRKKRLDWYEEKRGVTIGMGRKEGLDGMGGKKRG